MYKDAIYPLDSSMTSHDSFILEHYGLNELNFEAVKNYRQLFASLKPEHPWNGLETKDFLYKIGAWGKLRNTSKEGLTLAGLLMFSEERMITEVLPQYFLEYRECLDGIETGLWSSRFTSQDGTWSGNLFDFYFKVTQSIQTHVQTEKHVQTALREVLINSLAHADYQHGGGIVVEMGQASARFSNPGLLLTPLEQDKEGTVSALRNPNLVKMLVLIGLCQRAGYGLKMLHSVWEQQSWPPPEMEQDAERERTVLTMHLQAVSVEVPRGIDTDTDDNETEQEELLLFEQDGEGNSYNNKSSINKENELDTQQTNSCINTENSFNKGDNSFISETNSCINSPNSFNKRDSSYNKLTSSSNYEAEEEAVSFLHEAEQEAATAVDEDTERHLWQAAELARRKRRLHPSRMEEIILELAAIKPLRLKEMAELLGRTPDGLRNNYLSKLTEEGKLRLKYPDQPNHPKQAYMRKRG